MTPAGEREMKASTIGLIVVLLVTVVALGIWLAFVTQQRGFDAPAVQPTVSDPGGEDEAILEDDGERGIEPLGRAAELSPVEPYSGSGVAVIIFDGTQFVHEVSATLPDPAEGKFYEGWLVRQQPQTVFISTGRLEKLEDGYNLQFQSDQDLSQYTSAVITEETEAQGLDGVPETHVLEGTFDF